jgi:hypothetical protein
MFVGGDSAALGEKSGNRALEGGSKIRPGSSLILQSWRDQIKSRHPRMFLTIVAPFPAGPRACLLLANMADGGVWPTERMMALDYCSCVTVTL